MKNEICEFCLSSVHPIRLPLRAQTNHMATHKLDDLSTMEPDNHTQLETVSVGVGRDDNTASRMEIDSSSQLCNVSSSRSESPCSGSCNSICQQTKGEQCGVTLGDADSSVKKKVRKRKDKVKADGPVYSDIIRCHICGDKASGMHYGVYSCEGCKGFFRRTQRLKIDYKPCPYWGQQDGCIISIGSRNKCQYCRYQKCLTLGMSSGAIRMGRVPKVEVQKLKYELDQKDSVSNESDERRRCRLFVDALADQFYRIVITIKEEDRDKFWKRCSTPFKSYMPNGTCVVNGMQLDLEGPPREITNRAEMARQCFTNMEITIEKYATFAKQREMFRRLSAQDQLTLFKGAALEVCAALSSGRYYHGIYRFPEINTYIRRDVAENSPFGESSTYKPEMMFYEMFNELGMTNKEIAVYCTFLLYTPDREGLVDRELVEAHQEKLAQMLYDELKRNHPDRHNLFCKLMDVTVSLRSLVPDHLERLKQIKMRCHGHLPTDISPLLGEVYGNRVMQAEDGDD